MQTIASAEVSVSDDESSNNETYADTKIDNNASIKFHIGDTKKQKSSNTLLSQYTTVRQQTEALCQPLQADDFNIQTMPDVSPVKWHIAHVSWFFETFLLKPYLAGYQEYHSKFAYIFNSYYETVGNFHPRPQRGLLNRPTIEQVFQYRAYIDSHMHLLLEQLDHPDRLAISTRTEVGINHEQQHQELILTDIKNVFAQNPLKPSYHQFEIPNGNQSPTLKWHEHDGGLVETGHYDQTFCYDNELPCHKSYLTPFKLANRLVTNGEFIEFIESGAYQDAKFWLSDAWYQIRRQNWHSPLYWEKVNDQWWHMTLSGFQPVDEHAPICHVNFYEADAYARWAGKRLPTEAEWETMAKINIASNQTITGNFRNTGLLHPIALTANSSNQQFFGDVWEWTSSPYNPYPGFKPLPGSLGEYNGKFMSSQMVLRGGSCITPSDHIRPSYRNFFYPKDQWQFSGFRLASDI